MRSSPDNPVVLDARVVTGSGGGPDKTILNSPRFLVAAGYRVLCAYMHPPGDPGFDSLRQKATDCGAPLLSVNDRGPLDLQVPAELLQICRRERVAIWHGHDYKSNVLGLLLRPFWPMRLVTTVHGWGVETGRAPFYYKIERRCLPYYESVICVSENLQEQCLASGVPAERCVLVENAIDTEDYVRRQTVTEAKNSLGILPGRLVIGTVGRLSPEKNLQALVHSSDHLLKDGLDLELIIVGDGDERAALERLIAELGRSDRVRLMGYQSDTRELYEAMDVFVFNSLREGLPNVVLEALAMEVPVVSTRVGGVPRVIQHDENGLLIAPDDQEGLTGSLKRLLQDADLRARFRASGRRTVETRYSFKVRMDKIRAIYDSLLPARSASEGSNGKPSLVLPAGHNLPT